MHFALEEDKRPDGEPLEQHLGLDEDERPREELVERGGLVDHTFCSEE